MDDAARVGVLQAGGHREGDARRLDRQQRALAAQALAQVLAVDEGEHHVRPALVVAVRQEVHDVVAADGLQQPRLALEARHGLGVLRAVEVQQLDRDVPAVATSRARQTLAVPPEPSRSRSSYRSPMRSPVTRAG